MISVQQLSKSYARHRAITDVSFDVPAGRVVGLLGPNGAGKSTTMRILAGVMPPSGGRATVDGLDCVADSLEVRRRLGYLPENAPLYPEMRVRSFLAFRGRLYGLRGGALRQAIDTGVQRCWLESVADRRIGQLSKGFKQRVGLASALLHDPPVVMLDEPTSGLDPTQILETRRLIRVLGRDKSVLFSSHILPEVEATCDEAVVIARGRVLAKGPIDELRAQGDGAGRYIIEISAGGEEHSLIDRIRGVKGVARVEAEDAEPGAQSPWRRVRVQAGDGAEDLREALADAALRTGVRLRELRREEASLEHLFVRVLESPAEPAAEAGS